MSFTELLFFFLAIYILFKAGPRLINVLRGKNPQEGQQQRRRNPFADFVNQQQRAAQQREEHHEGDLNIEKMPKKTAKKNLGDFKGGDYVDYEEVD